MTNRDVIIILYPHSSALESAKKKELKLNVHLEGPNGGPDNRGSTVLKKKRRISECYVIIFYAVNTYQSTSTLLQKYFYVLRWRILKLILSPPQKDL